MVTIGVMEVAAPEGRVHAWVGGRVVLPDGVRDGHAVLAVDGRVAAVCREADLPADAPRTHVGGAYLAPGFVDLHTHGAVGRSFLGGDRRDFAAVLREQARHGVTSVLATTSTAPLGSILATLQVARDHAPGPGEARLLGVHMEGPYFAPSQVGAQDPRHLRTPDDGSVEAVLEHADVLRMVSFAPELPGAVELTRRLVAAGVVAAAGHSAATDADLEACVREGLSHAIHLWSGQSTTRREGPWRLPGLLEATLASETLTAEMIADGKHLPPTLMRLAYKALGPGRLCLVSDAVAGAGLPDGARFTLGEATYEVVEGVGMLLDRSAFAGSTTFLDAMVRVTVERVGVPLHEAVRMAGRTPAAVVGLEAEVGSLVPGARADMALLSPELRVLATVVGGRTAYRAEEAP